MAMTEQSKNLIERLKAFDAEVVGFVGDCSGEGWGKMCAPEDWTAGGFEDMNVGMGRNTPHMMFNETVTS
jgi:hypothetical protein